jgi:hypothetical protein
VNDRGMDDRPGRPARLPGVGFFGELPPLRDSHVRIGPLSGLTINLSLKGQAWPLLYTGFAGRFVV